ncbi:MAG TPA: M20/M25/M40 family metallo-hydrolase [Pyrinomonadaceae bacterium]|nr:M20/M25/M40 family metallo-hydrolase [Pyrinomonadaceae bacterium]
MIDVLRLTRELIDIPSVSGEEFQIGTALGELLLRHGYHVELQDVSPERSNIIATTQAKPRVVLSTHMDTVPPFIGSSENDEFIYGRGACDAKGIIAAQIAAAEHLRAEGINEIGLLFTVDEEVTSAGARIANDHPAAESTEFLINGEPTDNRLAIGTKGSLQATISTTGRAAHSAYPEQGESAIEKLLDVLNDIRGIDWPGNDVFGETTCNIGIVSGGTRANVIPDNAQATVQIRLADSGLAIKEHLEYAVAGRAAIDYKSVHDPIRLLTLDGFEQMVARFTTDIPYLSNWGRALLIGPGSILVAHTDDEKVSKPELINAVDLYANLAKSLLRQ